MKQTVCAFCVTEHTFLYVHVNCILKRLNKEYFVNSEFLTAVLIKTPGFDTVPQGE